MWNRQGKEAEVVLKPPKDAKEPKSKKEKSTRKESSIPLEFGNSDMLNDVKLTILTH